MYRYLPGRKEGSDSSWVATPSGGVAARGGNG